MSTCFMNKVVIVGDKNHDSRFENMEFCSKSLFWSELESEHESDKSTYRFDTYHELDAEEADFFIEFCKARGLTGYWEVTPFIEDYVTVNLDILTAENGLDIDFYKDIGAGVELEEIDGKHTHVLTLLKTFVPVEKNRQIERCVVYDHDRAGSPRTLLLKSDDYGFIILKHKSVISF